MRLTNSRLIGVLAAAVAFASSPAMAQGKGHGHDKDHGNKGRQEVIRDRDGRVVIINNGDVRRVPPGLAKKPGQMPPGQYKKRYTTYQGVPVLREVFVRNGYTVVRTTPYGSSQYVYYRAPNGTLQRAIITPGSDRLGFTNVPAAILQEVLSRLY